MPNRDDQERIADLERRVRSLEQLLATGERSVDQKLKELELELMTGVVQKLQQQGVA